MGQALFQRLIRAVPAAERWGLACLRGMLRVRGRQKLGFLDEADYAFPAHERALLPGAPATPVHPWKRRVLYGLIGVLVGIVGGLGNAIVSSNIPYLQGALGLDLAQMAWLPTAYVIANVSVGAAMVKYRQRFGLRSFAMIFLALYAALCLGHLLVWGLGSAIAVRAASGVAGSALSSLGLFYTIQAFPEKWRLKASAIGIGLPQVAIPAARLFPTEMLALNAWRGLYLFEFGLAAVAFAAVALVRLPPNVRVNTFEWADLPTLLLYGLGVGLICAVLGLGRFAWWQDSAWIGWALAASIPLLVGVFLIEYHRARPLIDMRWLGGADLLRFALVSILARVVLSEQATGAVGLLNIQGLNNDQFMGLSWRILVAAVAGVVVSAILIRPNRLSHLMMLSIGMVAVGAFADAHASNLTRAPQFYATQMLIAFSTTFFIGPALLFGLTRVIALGGRTLTSFIVIFNTTQSVGGLIGPAILGTYLDVRQRSHWSDLVAQLSPTNPLVAARLTQDAAVFAPRIDDPALRTAQGVTLLSQQVGREAWILAYNDTFVLIGVMATLTALLMLASLLARRFWPAAPSNLLTAKSVDHA
jgi:MFS family permease